MKTRITLVMVMVCCSFAVMAGPAEMNFDKDTVGATTVGKIKGRFKIVKVADGNNALQLYSLNKKDSGGIKLPLGLPKEGADKFTVNIDFRGNSSTTSAARILAITSYNSNQRLFKLDAPGGASKLMVSNYTGSKLEPVEICKFSPDKWLTAQLKFDMSAGKCHLLIKDKSSGEELYKGSTNINKSIKPQLLYSSTFPGQRNDGYSYDLDNIKVTVP